MVTTSGIIKSNSAGASFDRVGNKDARGIMDERFIHREDEIHTQGEEVVPPSLPPEETVTRCIRKVDDSTRKTNIASPARVGRHKVRRCRRAG